MQTTDIKQRPFTASEYHTMAHAGILGEDDRVELLNGQIIAMAPIGSPHAACVDRLNRLFYLRIGEEVVIRVQNPIRLDDYSEPEPDVALVVSKEIYVTRHPRPDEVLLVIEVADTSVAFDREVKGPLYARAGVPEVWVVALEEGRIYGYRRPEATGYAEETVYERDAELTVAALPAAGVFAAAEILGP